MSTARFIVGDTRAVTATIPDASVDLVLTSPPFLALRSYLPADHPDKAMEIGSEATPAAYLDVLLELTAEWGRVLAPHGSLCVELGDTYSGSGGAGGDYNTGGLRDGQAPFTGSARAERKTGDYPDRNTVPRPSRSDRTRPDGNGKVFRGGGRGMDKVGAGWPLPKCLTMIPELYRVALAYGINPLTGQPSPAGRWRVRNVVRWVRPNPPVGALGDKVRPATSDIVIACRHGKRYFDLDSCREPSDYQRAPSARATAPGKKPNECLDIVNPAGAPPLDWWLIPPGGYPGSHYAVWPPELLTRPIKLMAPPRVCTTCGRPSERLTGEPSYVNNRSGEPTATTTLHLRSGRPVSGQGLSRDTEGQGDRNAVRVTETLGWSDCGHGTWRPGHVLDPFGGSGTTGLVATGHGHNCTLIDIDARNADLAVERLGMFVTVEHHQPEEAA